MAVARFVAGAADPAQWPTLAYPEIAFAGRSNVGKSSLLNRLIGHRSLARVSKTPGRTQQINFFVVNERLTFVDLPGYGFARVPLEIKQRWKALVEEYLSGRPNLRAVVVLIDLRRGLEADDASLVDYLAAQGVVAIVVATKADKLARGARTESARALTAALAPYAVQPVICSAVSGDGVSQLWALLESVASPRRSVPRA